MQAALRQWRPSFLNPTRAESQEPHIRRIFNSGDPLDAENEKGRRGFADLALRILKPLIESSIET